MVRPVDFDHAHLLTVEIAAEASARGAGALDPDERYRAVEA